MNPDDTMKRKKKEPWMEDQMKYSDMIPVQNFMENKREIVLRILVMENN